MTSLIISAFPLSGKTYTFDHRRELDISCVDVDSFVSTDNIQGYIDCIKSHISVEQYILVSYKPEVRVAMMQNHISFINIAPTYGAQAKEEWFARTKSLTADFYERVRLLEEQFDTWTSSSYESIGHPLYTYHTSEYLSDILELLE